MRNMQGDVAAVVDVTKGPLGANAAADKSSQLSSERSGKSGVVADIELQKLPLLLNEQPGAAKANKKADDLSPTKAKPVISFLPPPSDPIERYGATPINAPMMMAKDYMCKLMLSVNDLAVDFALSKVTQSFRNYEQHFQLGSPIKRGRGTASFAASKSNEDGAVTVICQPSNVLKGPVKKEDEVKKMVGEVLTAVHCPAFDFNGLIHKELVGVKSSVQVNL
jgi:hypothetical protein